VGDLFDGVITRVEERGAVVNIGGWPGWLVISLDLKARFQAGDQVQGMKVEHMRYTGQAVLSLEEPDIELAILAFSRTLPTLVLSEDGRSRRPRCGTTRGMLAQEYFVASSLLAAESRYRNQPVVALSGLVCSRDACQH